MPIYKKNNGKYDNYRYEFEKHISIEHFDNG